jgi:hypothetical protein
MAVIGPIDVLKVIIQQIELIQNQLTAAIQAQTTDLKKDDRWAMA